MPTSVAATPSTKPNAVRTAVASAAAPGGYVRLFAGRSLRSSADDSTSAQAWLAQSMAPNMNRPEPAGDSQSKPEAVTTQRRYTGWQQWLRRTPTDGSATTPSPLWNRLAFVTDVRHRDEQCHIGWAPDLFHQLDAGDRIITDVVMHYTLVKGKKRTTHGRSSKSTGHR